ncbi:MAG TPA: hypothetical protein VMT30_02035, partial [Candidatus Saccharimonadia bacterium]|nr:hypothetical protein [Candidatus Saccharimonadia bacterium]
ELQRLPECLNTTGGFLARFATGKGHGPKTHSQLSRNRVLQQNRKVIRRNMLVAAYRFWTHLGPLAGC